MFESVVIASTYVVAEGYLAYLNYIARVKYKRFFREMTGWWRFLDKKNPVLSIIAGIAYTGAAMAILLWLQLFTAAGVLLGIVICNAVVDDISLRRRIPCIKSECPKIEATRSCVTCDEPEKYRVNMFTQKIKLKKVKKR
jgi:hypothetical protein